MDIPTKVDRRSAECLPPQIPRGLGEQIAPRAEAPRGEITLEKWLAPRSDEITLTTIEDCQDARGFPGQASAATSTNTSTQARNPRVRSMAQSEGCQQKAPWNAGHDAPKAKSSTWNAINDQTTSSRKSKHQHQPPRTNTRTSSTIATTTRCLEHGATNHRLATRPPRS